MLSPIVIPGYLALAYVTALALAALGMVAWSVESHLSKPGGRHRSAAAIAEADTITETLTGEIVTDEDIDPAPELEAPAPPRDALDPAMPIADVEAFLALLDSTHELAEVK